MTLTLPTPENTYEPRGAALKHNLELVQHAGKESRLTNGDPTENHSVKFIRGVDGEGI